MTKNELNEQFEILKSDVSGLVNTGQIKQTFGILDCRIAKGEDGKYRLLPLPEVTNREERVRVILGAIFPTFSARDVMDNHRDLFTGEISEALLACKPQLETIDNQCVTMNRLVYTVLLYLRYEGVLEWGETPLCGDRDPEVFLRELISGSGLSYADTLLALLDNAREEAQEGLFITGDPDEKPGEKLDRAVMLLSLLSADDIHEFGRSRVSYSYGCFSQFFNGSSGKIILFFMLGCPKLRDLFKVSKIAERDDEGAASTAENLIKIRDKCLGWGEGPIAVSGSLYTAALLQCANAGVSCSSWLYNADDIETASAAGVTHWLIEEFDDRMADLIMKKEGYYLLASEAGKLHAPQFYDLRKYIVDNGFLTDVWYISKDMDIERHFECFEIDTHQEEEPAETIRYYNASNNGLQEEYASLGDLLFGVDDSAPKSKIFKSVPKDEIVDNDYKLGINLYNSYDYASSGNPVLLSQLLTPVEGNPTETAREFYDEKVITARFSEDPLENYSEASQAGRGWTEVGDVLFPTKSALILRNTWPMHPKWVPADPALKEEDQYLGIIARDGKHALGFTMDTSKANPWYVAYRLSQATWQFRDRADADGSIQVKNLLKMYVDLPSLAEQKKVVEDVITQELERKKKQVGAADTLFNLAHTIGLPANRIQSILGNLKDVCQQMPDVYTDLKKVGDNFDYILRVINSTSKDFSESKDPLKEQKILPILEKFISAFSSLPFGLDPVIDHGDVPADTKLKVNETLLMILCDNILRNAHRHGFNKMVSKDHKVLIKLSLAKHEGRDYYMMSFCNNGNKLEPYFSIYDFISRGKKGKTTGNTGQGGYDIYQIVRKFDGRLGLRSSDAWNFILDVLIPVPDLDEHTIVSEYTYGALV